MKKLILLVLLACVPLLAPAKETVKLSHKSSIMDDKEHGKVMKVHILRKGMKAEDAKEGIIWFEWKNFKVKMNSVHWKTDADKDGFWEEGEMNVQVYGRDMLGEMIQNIIGDADRMKNKWYTVGSQYLRNTREWDLTYYKDPKTNKVSRVEWKNLQTEDIIVIDREDLPDLLELWKRAQNDKGP